MKHLKHIIPALLMALTLTACGGSSTAAYTASVMENAWTGDFSDSQFKSAIKSYEKNCEPMQLDTAEDAARVELEVGAIDGFEVWYASPNVDTLSPEEETQSYVDLWIPAEYDAESGCIVLDLSSCSGSGTVWGYLVNVTSGDTDSWYYFRAAFPADE